MFEASGGRRAGTLAPPHVPGYVLVLLLLAALCNVSCATANRRAVIWNAPGVDLGRIPPGAAAAWAEYADAWEAFDWPRLYSLSRKRAGDSLAEYVERVKYPMSFVVKLEVQALQCPKPDGCALELCARLRGERFELQKWLLFVVEDSAGWKFGELAALTTCADCGPDLCSFMGWPNNSRGRGADGGH